MSGPSWLADVFAAVMLAVAVGSFGRLVLARVWSRPTHVDIDLMHLFMGVAMAGMFVGALNGIPEGLWEVVFCISAAWFIWRCYDFVKRHGFGGHDEDHVHHLSHFFTHVVMSLAMLDMYFAVPGSTMGGAGMEMGSGSMAMGGAVGTTADFLFLPMIFFFALSGSAIWELNDLDRLRRLGVARTPVDEPALVTAGGGAPEVPTAIALAEGGTHNNAHGRWFAPRAEAAAHIAMCIAMGYMLVLMF